jgi:hypothetical protein
MTIRHHLEFQAGRMAEPSRTADYEEFVQRYSSEEKPPTYEEWEKELIIAYGANTGRVRVWRVTREEIVIINDPDSDEIVAEVVDK